MHLVRPFALSTLKFKLDIVYSVRWPAFSILLFRSRELFSEDIVVMVLADFLHHDLLLVVRDLVDDVLGSALVQL